MVSNYELNKALRLRPQGFDYIRFDDESFTRAFLSCFNDEKLVTIVIGSGGSGKSEILKMLSASYGKKALCVAPTGVASHNIEVAGNEAATIHSALGLPLKPFYGENEFFAKTVESLSSKTMLLIDEVSMVNSNMLDTILRHVKFINTNRRSASSKIHVVLFGDPLQLGPVFQRDKLGPILEDHPELEKHWEFFNSKELKKMNPEAFVLKTVYRQSDLVFKKVLSDIRLGVVTDEDLGYLNSRVGSQVSDIQICSTNAQVDEENRRHIEVLAKTETPYIYNAQYTFGDSIRDCSFNDHLEIYIGSRVMCTRNHYDEYGTPVFQNGTIGEVVAFEKGTDGIPLPIVKADDGREFLVPRMEFSDGEFRRNSETKKIEFVTLASAMQIPLRACYALTYHKCQGLTLPSAHLVISNVPQPGLLYMGLSRVRNPEGLTLSKKVTKDMFRVSPSAKHFIEEAERIGNRNL